MVCQWVVASLTNDPQRLARYAGFAKGGLAGGLAAAFGTEAGGLTQLNVLAFCFSLQFAGLFCLLGVCWKCVQPTNYFKEETVIIPVAVEKTQVQDIEGVELGAGAETSLPKSGQVTDCKVSSVEGDL